MSASSQSRKHQRSIARDGRGQVPFAIVAIMLLSMSSFTVILFHENQVAQSSLDEEVLESMDLCASSMMHELEDNAHALAVDVSGSDDPGEEFDAQWHRYLNRTFPRWSGAHTSAVEHEDLTLMPLEANDARDVPVRLFLVLRGTIWVNVTCGASIVVRSDEVDRPVLLPSPLVDVSAEAMADVLKGNDDLLTTSLSYQLATLAQVRVLEGRGSESLMGPMGTREVLRESDVMAALEQSLELIGLQEFGIVPDTGNDMIGSTGIDGGAIDPAKALLELMDCGTIKVSTLLSMAIQASLDQLYIRPLEYFHFDRFIELFQLGLDKMIDIGLDQIDSFLDRELRWNELFKHIEGEFMEHGMHQGNFRWWNGGWPNLIYEIEPMDITLMTGDGTPLNLTVGGPVELNLTTSDIMRRNAWGTLPDDWFGGAYDIMGTLNGFLHDLSTAIGSCDSLGTLTVEGEGNAFASMREQLEHRLREGSALIEDQVEDCASDLGALIDGDAYIYSYVEDNADMLLENGQVAEAAMDDIIVQLLESDVSWRDHLDVEEASTQLGSQLKVDHWVETMGPVEQRLQDNKEMLMECFATAFLDAEGGSASCLLDHLGPGDWLGNAVYGRLLDMLDNIETCQGLRDGTVALTPLEGASSFRFQGEDLTVDQRLTVDLSRVSIDVKGPWDDTGQANMHTTENGRANMTPYQTFWSVEVRGPFTVVADATSPILPMDVNATEEGDVLMELLIPVFSGWPLSGVEYQPSSTLWGDAMDVLEGVWQALLNMIDAIGRTMRSVVDATLDGVSSILSGAVQGVIWLADIMEDAVSAIQQWCINRLDGLVGGIATTVSKVLPQSRFNIDAFGLEFSVELDPMDLALHNTRDLVRVSVSIPMGNGCLDLQTRLLRFGPGDHGIISDAELIMGENIVSLRVDPLMRLSDHLIELNLEKAGTRVDIMFPKIVQYQSFRLSLADIPGLGAMLSSIPLPWPGIKGSFDAGFEVKYDQPFVDHLVINEIEQNPNGPDAGGEWVELYNPSERPVDLLGWVLQSSHGIQSSEVLGGMIPGRSRVVVHLAGQALDNGYGAKVPGGERLLLLDANGTRVDSTPWCTDLEDDGRTWQRHYDGSDRWVFKDATMGVPNGRRDASCSSYDWIRATLVDSALTAAAEMGGMAPTIDDLARLLELTIRNLLREVIDLIAETIVEMEMFITAGVTDLTSASGGGLSFSLVVTSECVREALEWVCDRMLELITGMDDVTVSRGEAHGLRFLAEDVYLRFTAYASIGSPRMLSAMNQERLTLAGSLETNVAAVGSFLGQEWGRPCMAFSATLAQVPGWAMPRMFGVDTDTVVDVHLVHALVYHT